MFKNNLYGPIYLRKKTLTKTRVVTESSVLANKKSYTIVNLSCRDFAYNTGLFTIDDQLKIWILSPQILVFP